DGTGISHPGDKVAHHCDIRSMQRTVARTRSEGSHARGLHIPVETAMPTGKSLVSAAVTGLGRVEQRDYKSGRLLASANPTGGLNILGNRLWLTVDHHQAQPRNIHSHRDHVACQHDVDVIRIVPGPLQILEV